MERARADGDRERPRKRARTDARRGPSGAAGRRPPAQRDNGARTGAKALSRSDCSSSIGDVEGLEGSAASDDDDGDDGDDGDYGDDDDDVASAETTLGGGEARPTETIELDLSSDDDDDHGSVLSDTRSGVRGAAKKSDQRQGNKQTGRASSSKGEPAPRLSDKRCQGIIVKFISEVWNGSRLPGTDRGVVIFTHQPKGRGSNTVSSSTSPGKPIKKQTNTRIFFEAIGEVRRTSKLSIKDAINAMIGKLEVRVITCTLEWDELKKCYLGNLELDSVKKLETADPPAPAAVAAVAAAAASPVKTPRSADHPASAGTSSSAKIAKAPRSRPASMRPAAAAAASSSPAAKAKAPRSANQPASAAVAASAASPSRAAKAKGPRHTAPSTPLSSASAADLPRTRAELAADAADELHRSVGEISPSRPSARSDEATKSLQPSPDAAEDFSGSNVNVALIREIENIMSERFQDQLQALQDKDRQIEVKDRQIEALRKALRKKEKEIAKLRRTAVRHT